MTYFRTKVADNVKTTVKDLNKCKLHKVIFHPDPNTCTCKLGTVICQTHLPDKSIARPNLQIHFLLTVSCRCCFKQTTSHSLMCLYSGEYPSLDKKQQKHHLCMLTQWICILVFTKRIHTALRRVSRISMWVI